MKVDLPPQDPYVQLGVSPNASPEEIRDAYRAAVRRLHPDLTSSREAEDQLREINAAYAALGKPERQRSNDTPSVSRHVASATTRRNRPMYEGMSERPERSSVTRSEIPLPVLIVPRVFSQLGIFLNDGSLSMSGPAQNGMSKADAVNAATRDVVGRFAVSALRKNFAFSIVTFDTQGRVQLAPTPATELDGNGSYDPRQGTGNGTFIGSGLRTAQQIAEEFLANASAELPTSVVIVVLSDGRDQEATGLGPDETLRIAEEIKQNPAITICTTHFGQKGQSDPEAESVLRRIASNPAVGFKTTYGAEDLRAFFLASVSAGQKI